MEITDLEPAHGDVGSGTRLLARFSAQVTPGIRLCGLRLVQMQYGAYRTYFPNVTGGGRSATVDGTLAKALTAAALLRYERQQIANDRSAA